MGYYSDAANNVGGMITGGVNKVATAVVAGKHLQNQEKANETNYINKQIDLAEDRNKIVSDRYVATELEKENLNEKQLLDTRAKYEIQSAKDAIDSGKLNDIKAAKIAIGQMIDKQSANREARLRIVQRLNDLDIKENSTDSYSAALNKANPKLAKKYGFGGNK